MEAVKRYLVKANSFHVFPCVGPPRWAEQSSVCYRDIDTGVDDIH